MCYIYPQQCFRNYDHVRLKLLYLSQELISKQWLQPLLKTRNFACIYIYIYIYIYMKCKGKVIPLQALCGPEGG